MASVAAVGWPVAKKRRAIECSIAGKELLLYIITLYVHGYLWLLIVIMFMIYNYNLEPSLPIIIFTSNYDL
jgi:hypothetical protein